MFFNDLIKRRLATLIQPWLGDNPDLAINLGLFRSNATLSNVTFQTSALNELLDDPSCICFKEVSVESLNLQISPCSSSALSLQIHGLHITLSLGEEEDEEGVRWRLRPKDTTLEEKNKALADIDPEGCALDDAIKRILGTTPATWTTSLLNIIISNCHLQLHDVNVLLQYPGSNGSILCSMYAKELGAGPESVACGSFLRGFMSSLFVPSEESSINAYIDGLEARVSSGNHTSCIVSPMNVHALINLKSLQLVSFKFSAPSLKLSFTPADISAMLVFYTLVSKESKRARPGLQLWNIASRKISSLLPTSTSSLVKVAKVVCLWLRYVQTYQHVLQLVGYPIKDVMEQSTFLMSRDKTYLRSVKFQWKLISEIEKELPPEAIALARRIVRSRVASCRSGENFSSKESVINRIFLTLGRVFVLIWTIICSVLSLVARILSFNRGSSIYSKTRLRFGSHCGDSLALRYIDFNIGEISIYVTPENADDHSIGRKIASDFGLSYQDLLSFHLSINACFLRYTENASGKCFLFVCGCWNVCCFSTLKGSPNNYSKSIKGRGKKKVNDPQTIIWGEPAKMIYPSEATEDNVTGYGGTTSIPYLDLVLGKLWLNWKNSCLKSEGYVNPELQSPWFLCEVRSSLTGDSLGDLSHGFWNCGMLVGRLNFNLQYLPIVSMGVVLSQTKRFLFWDDRSRRKNFLSRTPTTISEDPPKDDNSKFGSYYSKIEMIIMRIFPTKHVELGVLIAGPLVHLSLMKDQFYVENDKLHPLIKQITLDFHNVELVLSPNLESNLVPSGGYPVNNDREPEYSVLKVPEDIDFNGPDNAIYCSQGHILFDFHLKVNGLKAYFKESSESQKYQVFDLSPTTIRLKGLRKEHHSFGSTMIALSASSHWMTTGFTALIFMDELYSLTKVISGLLYDLPHALSNNEVSHQEVSGQEAFHIDSETGRTFMGRKELESLVITCTRMSMSNTCELKSFDIIIHNSRKGYDMGNSSRGTGTKLPMHEMPSHGIYIAGPKLFMHISFKGENMDVIIDLSGFRSIVFRYPPEFKESIDRSEINNLLCSLNFLIEGSISHIKFCFFWRTVKKGLPPASLTTSIDEPNSDSNVLHMASHSPLVMNTELHGDHTVLATISLSEIYLSSCTVKDILAREHEPNKLNASFAVGGGLRRISCDSKGGFLLVEATSAAFFAECCTSYYNRLLNLWSAGSALGGIVPQFSEETATLDVHSSRNRRQLHVTQEDLEEFSINISHLFLIFVCSNGSGILQELLLEINCNLHHTVTSTVKKISLGISKFSMNSRCMHVAGQKLRDIEIDGFSSGRPGDLSPNLIYEGSPVLEQKDTIHSVLADMGHLVPSSQNDIHIGSSGNSVTSDLGQLNMHLRSQNYVVKEFRSSIAAEWRVSGDQTCPNKLWVGNGSISGLDLAISLTEIEIIVSAFESFSWVFVKEKASGVGQRQLSDNQDFEESDEEMVADGTIVAIQDVDQHMYIAVTDVESGYGIVGAIHYSLVGERCLFRVKYHNAKQWKSQAQCFSLISLYAKDDSGEPLRLNCRPRLGFVDISCSNDSRCALWAAIPFRPDHYGDDVELESLRPLVRRTFRLVNKKNESAVAFIDDVLEFVSKPGNLFKWKVFRDPPPESNGLLPTQYLAVESGSNRHDDSNVNDTKDLKENEKLSGVTIAIDKITLTILHELSDTGERFPLLQGSISLTETILQISNIKMRFMNRLEVILYYFDAQQSSWREFLHPLEFCCFYSSKFLIPGSDTVLHRVQSHFYARIKEATVSLNEVSLDIILLVIGKLNLAGPFATRSSVLLANCCKVKNQSGLTLHCEFYDSQKASVSSRQSTTIFLRHLAPVNQHPEASFFSIQLSRGGFLSSSPIHLSTLDAQKFAWRTRIVSQEDSKSFPGPFVVVEVSRGIEDGLSISVSPLLKIHNDTDFSLELRFQRPQHKETHSATLVLKAGDVLDDIMAAFGATGLSGGLRKTLTSLSVGNFIFSLRPDIGASMKNSEYKTAEWSDDLQGGKPVSLSGVFDKLSYRVRKAFSVESEKCSLSTAHCALKSEEGHGSEIHFLIQSIRKDVPVIRPDNFGNAPANKDLPVALQEQKEIFLLPTVHVSNLLHTEIHVNLTEGEPLATIEHGNPWSCATIPGGSAVNLYANPATIYFTVTLTSFRSSCKPVNSKDWVRKLQKQKSAVHHLDIELDFDGGKYSANLRLSRRHRGVLEATIFTTYAMENSTDTSLFCFSANQKPPNRYEVEMASNTPPDLGSYLLPKSVKSWFVKSHKVRLKLLEEKASEAQLDLDSLSGLTEIDLEVEANFGLKSIMRLGVSLRPSVSKVASMQMVSLNPRYVVCNESENPITIRQCYLEDDMEGLIAINSKERIALRLKSGTGRKRETSVVDYLFRKHTKSRDDVLPFIQFRTTEAGLGWSGPVCVASLGRFFLKFRRSSEFSERRSDSMSRTQNTCEFAAVNVLEGGPTITLHFHRPANTNLPYRIENCLHHAPITYYQKGSSEPETLGAGRSVNYVWDDLTLPRKLVIQVNDLHMLCEINLDKVRSWKPLYRTKQNRGLGFHLPGDKGPGYQKRTTYSKSMSTETVKLGYEVYADGVTRVLRICEFSDSHKVDSVFQSGMKMRLRISYFAIHLLGRAKQEMDLAEPSNYAPIVTSRLDNIHWDSMFTDRNKYNQIRVQSLSVDEKWTGAPFAAMLRRHQSENTDSNEYILRVISVLVSSSSQIKQVKYLSIVLQPLDLNLDEETLMRIVPFWRTSLSDSSAPSRQYYFDHFEIHPIKVVGSFLPGDSYSSYSSTQETLRSLLHSVIKVPTIKNMTVELNGVLVTHALITLRELTIKCAKHYSWYAMRAIYIAKGSPLLPPSFTSIFDDLASSSLDVFFDPSSGLPNLPGVTIGTLKLISKFINDKGFSGTKRYFGDLGKTLKMAGSNILFAAVTEISDSVLKGAETNGIHGLATGFRHGILKIAMEPSVLGSAFMEGGPDRKIKLDRSPGVDELYIEGYLQAMLDTMYKQEYLRVRVIENQVVLKNLPPNSALIEEIMERVKSFLVNKGLLKGESSKAAESLRHIRGEKEWRIGPTVLTLCEHLFVSFAIRALRKQAGKVIGKINWPQKLKADEEKAIVPAASSSEEPKVKIMWKWGIGKFVLSGMVAYVDGRLCRNIPNPVVRRIVSGFLLSFLDQNDE